LRSACFQVKSVFKDFSVAVDDYNPTKTLRELHEHNTFVLNDFNAALGQASKYALHFFGHRSKIFKSLLLDELKNKQPKVRRSSSFFF